MNPDLDAGLLARIEDAGINASAPRQQRWIDGWLVRTCPGKAKRARCIQAVSAGRLPVADKLARCLPVYAAAGLQPYVRITPFSEPQGLDDALGGLGMVSLDDTRVLVHRDLGSIAATATGAPASLPPGHRIEPLDGPAYSVWLGTARGSSAAEQAAHRERTEQSPVPYEALVLRDAAGTIVAGGQVAIEANLAGLYDVITTAAERGRGHAATLCSALLGLARSRGAAIGYLQVDANNAPALAVYHRLGFVDGYRYHYRTPASAGAD